MCLIGVISKPGVVAPTRRQRNASWIKIVEVKYAPDLEVHGAARDQASEQHLTLAKDLRDYGWGLVEIYPVVVGNAGTMPTDGDVALQALGVSAADRLKLLSQLAVDSAKHTAEVITARLNHVPLQPSQASAHEGAPSAPDGPGPAPDPDGEQPATTAPNSVADRGAHPPDPPDAVHSAACADTHVDDGTSLVSVGGHQLALD